LTFIADAFVEPDLLIRHSDDTLYQFITTHGQDHSKLDESTYPGAREQIDSRAFRDDRCRTGGLYGSLALNKKGFVITGARDAFETLVTPPACREFSLSVMFAQTPLKCRFGSK
jgi:hypothetical protein